MEISAIKTDELNAVWPYIIKYIQEPLSYEHGDLTPEDIYLFIESGDWVLLIAYEDNEIYAAQTCEIIDIRGERVMNLVTTGGSELNRWQDCMALAIDAIAMQHGCNAIQTRGRIGWLKQLKRNGYVPAYFIAVKRIT